MKIAAHPVTTLAPVEKELFPGSAWERFRSACVVTCSVLLTLLGVLVLAGWSRHQALLLSVLPGRVSMKANTASGLLSCGLALFLASARSARLARWSRPFSAFSFLLGALSLAEFTFGLDLGIDQLLFSDPTQTLFPGRMAQVSAIAFCLGGASLWLLTGGRLARRVSHLLAAVLGALAFTSVVGFLYGVPILYGSSSNVNSMALHTGVGFLLLSFGLVLAREDSTVWRLLAVGESGSWMVRRVSPLIVVAPVLVGFLYLQRSTTVEGMRFGMALFAVTLVLSGLAALLLIGASLNRDNRQQLAIAQAAAAAAAAAEASERELLLLTDNLPTLIAYLDPEGRLLRANKTHEQWLGKGTAQIVGQTVDDLLGIPYWERTSAARDMAARGAPGSVETVFPTAKGDRRVLVTFAADRTDEGEVRGFACMVMDVEDQRRAEAALRETEKLAAVGRLSSSIAHEINNPLDAVTNLVYIAREQSADAEIKLLLSTADSELKRITNIAGQTLRFHRKADQTELVHVTDLFASVLTLHRARLRSKAIQVQLRERSREPFECFEGEIRQVLNNLVANAVDAMAPGGRLYVRSRPTAAPHAGRPGVTITVADTGCGMDEHTLGRVLEAFFTTKGDKGTGLGLWITEEILTRHSGRLRIRSSTRAACHGSVFTIFLPLKSNAVALEPVKRAS